LPLQLHHKIENKTLRWYLMSLVYILFNDVEAFLRVD
jgi:hypothetical protein